MLYAATKATIRRAFSSGVIVDDIATTHKVRKETASPYVSSSMFADFTTCFSLTKSYKMETYSRVDHCNKQVTVDTSTLQYVDKKRRLKGLTFGLIVKKSTVVVL